MQDNSIAVTRGDASTVTFTRFAEEPNRSTYIAGDHSIALPHTLSLARVLPRPSRDSAGVARTRFKVTKGVVIGEKTVPIICEVAYDYPVGTSSTDLAKVVEEIKLLAAAGFVADLTTFQEI